MHFSPWILVNWQSSFQESVAATSDFTIVVFKTEDELTSFVCYAAPPRHERQSLCSCSLSGLDTESFCNRCEAQRGDWASQQQQRSWRSEHFAERLRTNKCFSSRRASERRKERSTGAAAALTTIECSRDTSTKSHRSPLPPAWGKEDCLITIFHTCQS